MSYNTRKKTRMTVDNTDTPSTRAKQGRDRPVATRVRRKGPLQELLKMPLDVMDEILKHLFLLDLLNLSRTNKDFRAFVYNRGAKSCWKAALENSQAEGLPPCPEWLTVLEYANLMYSTHCHNCCTGNVQPVFFVLGVRLCKKCQKVCLLELLRAHVQYRDAYTLCPSIQLKKRTYPTRFYLKADLEELTQLLQEGRIDEDWKIQRLNQISEKKAWAEECEAWLAGRMSKRGDELQKAKERRLAAVLSKLEELGWKEDVDFLSNQTSHPLWDITQVRQPRPLTDKAWLDMEDEVLYVMNQWKQVRLGRIHYQLLSRRTRLLKEFLSEEFGEDGRLFAHLPATRNLVDFSAIKAIIDSPDDVSITLESFAPLRDIILDLLASFQQEQKTMLREWVEEAIKSKLPADVNVFDLAITSQLLDLDGSNLFEHYFLKAKKESYLNDDDLGLNDMYGDLYDTCMNKITRRYRRTSVYPHWNVIKYVIETAGEDPANVTAATMDRKEMRWYCADSCYHSESRVIMNWRAAICHIVEESERHTTIDVKRLLAVVKPEEAKQVAHLERAELRRSQKHKKALYLCTRCPARLHLVGKAGVRDHLNKWHGIAQPAETDFQLDYNRIYPTIPFFIISKATQDAARDDGLLTRCLEIMSVAPNVVLGTLSTYEE